MQHVSGAYQDYPAITANGDSADTRILGTSDYSSRSTAKRGIERAIGI
jgi:hypothetical protein